MSKFSDLREQFLGAEAQRGLAPRTLRLYRGDLVYFETWFEQANHESPDPISVLRSDVRNWQEAMRAAFRPTTVNRRLTAIRTFYAWAERQGLLSRNPASQVHGVPLPGPGNEPPALDLPEAMLEKILQEVRSQGDRRDRAMLELLCDAGLRPREICALTVADYTREASSARLQIRSANGGHAVQLSVRARVAVDEYLETRSNPQGASPLILSRKKKAVTPFILWHRLKRYAARAGVPEIHPQAVRRSVMLRYLRQSNGDLLAAAERFGQGDLNRLGKLFTTSSQKRSGKGGA
jgi:site-specific recombinase XerD